MRNSLNRCGEAGIIFSPGEKQNSNLIPFSSARQRYKSTVLQRVVTAINSELGGRPPKVRKEMHE
jgi:hypothetical protein